MPPAPTMTTRSPTGGSRSKRSAYEMTCGSSLPASRAGRGTTPVARATASNARSSEPSATRRLKCTPTPESPQFVREIANRFAEVALSRNAARHAKLASELAIGLKQLDSMAERRERARTLHPGWSSTDHGDAAPALRRERRFGEV